MILVTSFPTRIPKSIPEKKLEMEVFSIILSKAVGVAEASRAARSPDTTESLPRSVER